MEHKRKEVPQKLMSVKNGGLNFNRSKREGIMKKWLYLFVALIGGVLLFNSPVFSNPFPVNVEIEGASSANYVVWKLLPGQPFPSTPQAGTSLDFTTTYNTGLGVYFGDEFFAIDVAPIGAGQLNVLIQYTDTENPNGSANDGTGLGIKGIATVVKADPVTHNEAELSKKVLQDINNTTIFASQLLAAPAGFMRMYVGLATGDPLNNEPAAAVPFNAGDKPGFYRGTITLTVSQP